MIIHFVDILVELLTIPVYTVHYENFCAYIINSGTIILCQITEATCVGIHSDLFQRKLMECLCTREFCEILQDD